MDVRKFGFDELRKKYTIEHVNPISEETRVELRRQLLMIGEELCAHARTTGAYTDRTSNLRSSIGFRLYEDGKVVDEGGFESTGGPQGVQKAHEALPEYESEAIISQDGFTLVIVAGMEYAAYVEAKGYNVLHLTSVEMAKEIKELKEEFGFV